MDELQKASAYLLSGGQATQIHKVCKGAKWIAGSYHLGENLLGPEGYTVCLQQRLQQIPLGNRL